MADVRSTPGLKLRLTSDRLLVEPLPTVQTSKIVLPDIAQDDANSGGPKLYRVLAIGPGKVNEQGVTIPMEIKAGDRVLAHSYTDGPTDLGDGTTRRIIRQTQVLLVLTDENVPTMAQTTGR